MLKPEQGNADEVKISGTPDVLVTKLFPGLEF
jgi:hypothetical protein